MTSNLVSEDPELALEHAQAARRRAPRLAVVREATGEAAYACGQFAIALQEFRTLRRLRGGDDYLPAIADCERALGKPQAALRLVKEGLAADPAAPLAVELRLVEAGARRDLGQAEEARRLLRAEVERLGPRGPKVARARLRYAYADLLEEAGESDLAEEWFLAAAALDADGQTDAEERAAALQGVMLTLGEDEEELAEDGAADTDGMSILDAADAEADVDGITRPGPAEPATAAPTAAEVADPTAESEAGQVES